MGKCGKHNPTRLCRSLAGAKRLPEQSAASECECVSKPQESAVCLADGLRAQRGGATLFSCNNAMARAWKGGHWREGVAAKAC